MPDVPIEDLRRVASASPFEADLCIVGSGPAGWTIAEEFRGTDLRIVMLESGGLENSAEADALNATDDVGSPLYNGRARGLGGTSRMWTGRCVAFDPIDYEERPWVPLSGWPFGADTMQPFVDRAAVHLGAGGPGREPGTGGPDGRGLAEAVDRERLQPQIWENPPITDFGAVLRREHDDRLRVLLHATVTHLDTDPSGRVMRSVEIADPEGQRSIVRTPVVVLCAGGVENARILLASDRVRPNGVGNENDAVGRYLSEHPRDPNMLLTVDQADAAAFRHQFGPFPVPAVRGTSLLVRGFKLSRKRQEEDGLLNCAAWAEELRAPDDPIQVARALLERRSTDRVADLWTVASQPRAIARAAKWRIRQKTGLNYKVQRSGFVVSSEQVPDRDSRVRLGERRDRLGLRMAEIDWRIGPLERASQAALARSIAREFARLGHPALRVADWVRTVRYERASFGDGCHPSGTTRMSTDKRHGVVDADCKVHDVEGLFVAGSSVFPTNSHANPTQMIVALAVRLSHHLRDSVFPRSEAVPPEAAPLAAAEAGGGTKRRKKEATGHAGQ